VMFAVAAGHYATLLWEDFDTCGTFISGYFRLPARGQPQQMVTLMLTWLRNATCFGIFVMGAKMWFPGLAMVTLLWEAPTYFTLYREAWVAANQLSYWLLGDASLWGFWRPTLMLLLVIRLPLSILLVVTSMDLTLSGEMERRQPEVHIRVCYHVACAALITGNLLYLPVLFKEYTEDLAITEKMRELGWPGGVSEDLVPKATAETVEGLGKSKSRLSYLFGLAGEKDKTAPKKEEQAEPQPVFPICQLGELPAVPQEQDISALNSISVQSAPPSS